MSTTITIPTELEQKIAGRAAAQGKDFQQIAIEMLVMFFDADERIEKNKTLRSLESARRGAGRPAKDVLEEIRVMLSRKEKGICPDGD